MAITSDSSQGKISKIEITHDRISGRGGLFFFLKFVEQIGFFRLFEATFSHLKRSRKGLKLESFIRQILAYFVEGSDLSLLSFDRRKRDQAYAALLGEEPSELASSHQMKRFFRKFSLLPNRVYRGILLHLFLWRLWMTRPTVIVLFVDSKVFDNDTAHKREGVTPTYRGVKGYHPLHIIWNGFVVDALFRPGNHHSNHGSDFIRAVGRLVRAIRKRYSADVPIIVTMDSGFLDQAIFRYLEDYLGVFYVCSGKLYADIKAYIEPCKPEDFCSYVQEKQQWRFVEFGNRLKSWNRFRRCIFTQLESEEDGQLRLDFAKTDQVIYTNIGLDPERTQQLVRAGGESYLQPQTIIQLSHQRGKGELTHRALSEFATKEKFPFTRMGMNRAYYYFLVIAYVLFEAYKQDMPQQLVPKSCYPNTFRRHFIDFAVKIVCRSRQRILKVTQTVWDHLRIDRLWEWLCGLTPELLLNTG